MRWIYVVGAQVGVSVLFCAIGFLMAFRPTVYQTWVRWSWVGRHASTWSESWLRRKSQHLALGILFIVFGLGSLATFLWIDFVQ
jgi:hypothetical protein